ncbi:MAG TPA: polysaccharide pyruvyl transferase family protein [Ilumatobacteraceae bacterium]|nr:polysaccharide pyruvyl transferase family protein [Ilumatobacteraceae bacterium]
MSDGSGLTVLIEPSDYVLRNAGDMAMMRVATSRLATMWPGADIRVLSDVPHELSLMWPNVAALDASGRRSWQRTFVLPERIIGACPGVVARRLMRCSRWLRVSHPALALALARWRLRDRDDERRQLSEYLVFLDGADLVLATGMGGVTDVFPEYAYGLLETLAHAHRAGAVTVMMGQGMGPLRQRTLRRYASKILNRVDFIALREERRGASLLIDDFHIDLARVVTTGDDAVELALERAPESLGDVIGVNLRVSYYSGVTQQLARRMGDVIRTTADELGASLVAAPISSVPDEDDLQAIRGLVLTGGAVEAASPRSTPEDAITTIARCRVVVTGSYHAAVFALSMGIPAIGIAASRYYEDKFLGLVDQFGDGCFVVFVDGQVWDDDLREKIEIAWHRADHVRASLMTSARRQVEAGHLAYAHVRELVEQRASARTPVAHAVGVT